MVSMITRASTRALFCVSLISSRAGNNSLILDPCEDATGNFPTGNLSTGCIPRTFVLAACRCSFLFSFLLSLLLFRAISLELFIISMRVKAASLFQVLFLTPSLHLPLKRGRSFADNSLAYGAANDDEQTGKSMPPCMLCLEPVTTSSSGYAPAYAPCTRVCTVKVRFDSSFVCFLFAPPLSAKPLYAETTSKQTLNG